MSKQFLLCNLVSNFLWRTVGTRIKIGFRPQKLYLTLFGVEPKKDLLLIFSKITVLQNTRAFMFQEE